MMLNSIEVEGCVVLVLDWLAVAESMAEEDWMAMFIRHVYS